MRHHAGKSKTDGEHQTKTEIELPQRRNLAAEKKARGKRETADDRNLFCAVAIEQSPDHGREQRINS